MLPISSSIGANDKNSSSFCVSAKNNEIHANTKQQQNNIMALSKEQSFHDQENKSHYSSMIEANQIPQGC